MPWIASTIRWTTVRIGIVSGVLLSVAYTERGERIRIISARKADSREATDYASENA